MITALLHCAERMAQARLIRTKRSQTPGQGGAVHNSPALRPPPYPAKPPPPPPSELSHCACQIGLVRHAYASRISADSQ